MKAYYVPIVTSKFGSTLTVKNLQDLGIEYIGVDLSQLLMKPGLPFLKNLDSLKRFFGWSNQVVLNASINWHSKTQTFCMQSSYDGHQISLTLTEYIELILFLKPDFVILPNRIDAFKHHLLDAVTSQVSVLEPKKNIQNANSLNITYMDSQNNQYYLSDHEAALGFDGRGLQNNTVINLFDKQYEFAFESIEQSCTCPSCQQSFTMAYFHHLINHTPLLCQRLLIMHNIWQVKNKLELMQS